MLTCNVEISLFMLCFICIIPISSSSSANHIHHIHHSALRENSFNTNRDKTENVYSKLPYYLKVPTSVQAYENADVILSCRIENLADKMVVWIRNVDLQILTAGLMTFSSDSRFSVNHENSVDEKDWSLLIKNVKVEDSGEYECQISTDPKMKLNINLLVKESIEMMEMDSPFHHQNGANIEGTNLNVLKQGQMITLTCRVTENEGEHSKRIEWMKDGEHVSLKTRNGVTTVDTIWLEKGSGVSKLTLTMLGDDDEGNYSCRSNGFVSDAVTLRVVSEELEEGAFLKKFAAQQKSGTSRLAKNSSLRILFVLFSLCLFL